MILCDLIFVSESEIDPSNRHPDVNVCKKARTFLNLFEKKTKTRPLYACIFFEDPHLTIKKQTTATKALCIEGDKKRERTLTKRTTNGRLYMH